MQAAITECSLNVVTLTGNPPPASQLAVLVLPPQLFDPEAGAACYKCSLPGPRPPCSHQLPSVLQSEDPLTLPPPSTVSPALVLALVTLPRLPAQTVVGIRPHTDPGVDGGHLLLLPAQEILASPPGDPLSEEAKYGSLISVNNLLLTVSHHANLGLPGVLVRR